MTPLHPYTLAQADFNQGLIIMVVGMLVVFSALAVLMGLIELINSLTAEKKSAAIAAPASKPDTTDDIDTMAPVQGTAHDPHMIAILTAAATAALRRPVAVKSARLVSTPPDSAWARQGRRSIMGSHRPYRRR
jgi:sodium pump decarboxylase gamma subunit